MNTNRRSFLSRLGAGTSAALASAAGMTRSEGAAADSAALKLARLEHEKHIRELHRKFELALEGGHSEELIGLFAENAEVVFNGGVFRGREQGLTRLFRDRMPVGKTGRRLEQAPGFELTAEQHQDVVDVAADLATATGAFAYSIQVGVPFETESSLAAMARLQGEGVRNWWEGGVYRVSYQNDSTAGWKIRRLEFRTLSRADWRQGKRYAQSIEVAGFIDRYPLDPLGPDELIQSIHA